MRPSTTLASRWGCFSASCSCQKRKWQTYVSQLSGPATRTWCVVGDRKCLVSPHHIPALMLSRRQSGKLRPTPPRLDSVFDLTGILNANDIRNSTKCDSGGSADVSWMKHPKLGDIAIKKIRDIKSSPDRLKVEFYILRAAELKYSWMDTSSRAKKQLCGESFAIRIY